MTHKLVMPQPMRASEGGQPFTDPEWMVEVKYEGYRCLARAGGGTCTELRAKGGTDCTHRFPEIADLLSGLRGGPHVIDGQACMSDEIGRASFESLQARAPGRRGHPGGEPATLCAFDLLYLDGRNVMALPLVERKAMLEQLLAPLREKLTIVADFPAHAAFFEQAVLGAKAEGFVAKRLASPYLPGVRSPDWIEFKRPACQEGRIWRK
jgi:bifunctional non-homologous end joining protein LigD